MPFILVLSWRTVCSSDEFADNCVISRRFRGNLLYREVLLRLHKHNFFLELVCRAWPERFHLSWTMWGRVFEDQASFTGWSTLQQQQQQQCFKAMHLWPTPLRNSKRSSLYMKEKRLGQCTSYISKSAEVVMSQALMDDWILGLAVSKWLWNLRLQSSPDQFEIPPISRNVLLR